MTRDRYLGISLTLLHSFRTVLPREADAASNTICSAGIAGMSGFRATGAIRTEALGHVRAIEVAARDTARPTASAREMMTPIDQS